MPIYEYRCRKCGEFEVTQRIMDAPLTRCPTCRGKVNKLMSSTSFQLKGSGWYVTDYGRGGKGKEKTTESTSETKTTSAETKSETKSDSKPSNTKEVAAA